MTTILPASAVPVDNVDDGGRRRQLDLAVDDHPETSRKQRVVGAGDGQLWTGDVHTQRKTQKRRQAWITCTCRRLWSAASRGTNNDAETSTSRRAAALGSSPTGKDVDDCYEDKQDDQNDDVDDKVWTYPEGGRGWFVVFGAFLFACCHMAYGLTWSIWATELKRTSYSHVNDATMNMVVGLTNFTMNAGSFVGGRLGDLFGYKRMMAISATLGLVCLIISAFVAQKNLALLFLFQGPLLGLSYGLALPLFLSIPSQWFMKRRGLATGLVASGSGIGGGVASLIVRALMPRVGYRYTMLIYAGLNAVAWLVGWQLLKERWPPLKRGERRAPKTWLPSGVWRRPSFYSFNFGAFFFLFGYLVPYYYLTSFTTLHCPRLDPTSIQTAVPLILANFTSGFGRIFSGFIADLIGPVNTLFVSFFLGGLFQVAMWPWSVHLGSIIAFALMEGFTGGWFMAVFPVAAAQLFGQQGLAAIVGFATLSTSPGQLAGASIAGVVLEKTGSYRAVAWYGGSMMLAGAAALSYARLHGERRIFAKF